jgi:hypothetical protein
MTTPPGFAHPSRAGRLVPLVLVVVAALVAAAVVVLPRSLPWGTAHRVVAGAPVAGPVPGGSSAAGRLADVAELLARRGQAVRKRDADSYAATQTAKAKAPLFARVGVLPWVRWTYTLGAPTSSSADEVVVAVRLTTRLAGETADAVAHETVTVRRSGSVWKVAAEVTRGDRAQLWELGALRVVTGKRSLVIGVDTSARTLRAYAALADRAVPRVSAVWGTGWSRFAVVVVPRTVAQLARALGRTSSSLSGYAAVTTAEGAPAPGAHAAQRIWTNTAALADLSSVGREVVLRHELTHVATYAPERTLAPLWLVEGVAEWTGYRGSGISLAVATGDLLVATRSGRLPSGLPGEKDFTGADVDIAYESAHLLCSVIVRTYGVAALVQVYRETVSGSGTPDEDAAAAVLRVTGHPLSDLESAWRARATALAR